MPAGVRDLLGAFVAVLLRAGGIVAAAAPSRWWPALDEHLPVGEGTFPFARLFAILRERKLAPILTVEAHSEKNLARTLANIGSLGILEGFGSPAAAEGQTAPPQRTMPAPGRS